MNTQEHETAGVTRPRHRNFRFTVGMGAFLFGALMIIAFTPAVLAQTTQTPQTKDQEYFQTLYEKYQDIQGVKYDFDDKKVLNEMFELLEK